MSEREAVPTPSRWRSPLSLAGAGLALIGLAFGVGLALGLVRGRRQAGDAAPASPPTVPAAEAPARESGELEREGSGATTDPASALTAPLGFPGLADDPLGSYADADESWRVLWRLALDLLRRPPTAAEEAALLPLPHAERWRRLREIERATLAAPTAGVRRAFAVFLARDARREELEALSRFRDPELEELGLWLSATREYRAPDFRRPRDLGQRARSLAVDLAGRPPLDEAERTLIERALLSSLPAEELASHLALAAPNDRLEAAALREWAEAQCRRFLGAAPAPSALAELVEELRAAGEDRRWFLTLLAASPKYRSY